MNLYKRAAEIDRLERLSSGSSPIHRVHPKAKIITTAFYIVTVISFPRYDISALLPFLLYPAVLMSLSGTPYKPLLFRLLVALPFSLMAGVSNIFLIPETALTIANTEISFGLLSFVSIMLKTLLTVFAVLILASTTSFIETGHQLVLMGLPKILILQLMMTYRYTGVLLGEVLTMTTAYLLRAPRNKAVKMRDMGSFLGQLILRSVDRAERVYQAMKCRGFDGIYRGKTPKTFSVSDYIYTITLSALMLFLRFFNLSLFFARLAY